MDRNALGSFWRQTIFGCLAYQNHSMLITLRSYEPAGLKLELGMKDILLIRDVAEAATLPLPLADLLHEHLLTSLPKGRQTIDWTSIELVTAEANGLS